MMMMTSDKPENPLQSAGNGGKEREIEERERKRGEERERTESVERGNDRTPFNLGV